MGETSHFKKLTYVALQKLYFLSKSIESVQCDQNNNLSEQTDTCQNHRICHFHAKIDNNEWYGYRPSHN